MGMGNSGPESERKGETISNEAFETAKKLTERFKIEEKLIEAFKERTFFKENRLVLRPDGMPVDLEPEEKEGKTEIEQAQMLLSKMQIVLEKESAEKLRNALWHYKRRSDQYSEFDMLAVAKEYVRRLSPQSTSEE